MKNLIIIALVFLIKIGFSQEPNWRLKFISNAEKDGKGISGVNIALMQGSIKVAETTSSGKGNFDLSIPPNGDYMVVVSYEGCNSKRFQVSTIGVPATMNKDNFDAVILVVGVIMSKPLYSIDYTLLEQPMLKISYDPVKKKFTDDSNRTSLMLDGLQKIRDAENALLEKYNAANKAGDLALKKRDCDIAKQQYEKATLLIPDEDYPKKQLELVIACVKEKEELTNKNKKAEEEKLRAAEAKINTDKLKAEQLANQIKEKQEGEKIAQEKAMQEKTTNDKLKAEQLETERLSKAKLVEEKSANDKLKAEQMANELKTKQEAIKTTQEKLTQDKITNDKLKTTQLEADKIAKAKTVQDKLENDRLKAEQLALDKNAKSVSTKTIEPTPKTFLLAKKPVEGATVDPIKKTEAKHSAPQGFNADKYKQTMIKASDFIKMKRYIEAKIAYQEALVLKPNDPIATAKLLEVEKLIIAPKPLKP